MPDVLWPWHRGVEVAAGHGGALPLVRVLDMGAAPILKVCLQREEKDCAVVALAMYLGASYEDVLRVVTLTDRRQGKGGLWSKTMMRIAKRLGHALTQRRVLDWNDDYGIVRLPDHAVILRNGLVIETNGTIWDADAYLSHKGLEPTDCQLLVCEDR